MTIHSDFCGTVVGKMAGTPRYHGSLVALEGPREMISTQCRLLPSSSNILVLPELEWFMKERPHESVFDPELYILEVHNACNARIEKAHVFLGESTPNKKRLVFMNGGAASARMKCITAISEHSAKGDVVKAELLFNEIIRNRVQGLQHRLDVASGSQLGLTLKTPEVTDEENSYQNHEFPDDPRFEAMRAADALDRKTEFLQQRTEIDLTVSTLRRSRSLPIHPPINAPDTPDSRFSRASGNT